MNQQKITTIASAIAIVVAVAMIFGANQSSVIAEEKKEYEMANGVKVSAIFLFMDGTEQISFQLFEQTTGFDREKQAPQFQLVGAISNDRPLLYKAADITYLRGKSDHKQEQAHFDVDVILENGMVLRKFHYEDCRVTDYKVKTEFDKDKPWVYKGGFAILDDFKFTCNGYAPVNTLLEYKMNNGEKAHTESTLDLKQKPDYTTHPKFQN
ncbi:MAG: hypothetical protein WD154_03030 [Nitrosopumilaceae archaeon]